MPNERHAWVVRLEDDGVQLAISVDLTTSVVETGIEAEKQFRREMENWTKMLEASLAEIKRKASTTPRK